MKKPTLSEVIVSLLILFGIPAWLYLQWFFSRPKTDTRTLEQKVKACLGLELTNLQASLELRPSTNDEPFVLTYLLPLAVDATSPSYYPNGLGRFRSLGLLDSGTEAQGYEINRQTNGTYLVKWNTLFAGSGSHVLQMRLLFPTHGSYDSAEVLGAKLEVGFTNLLQWDYDGTGFGKRSIFDAKLQISSADYSIFIYDTNRAMLKRIDGYTENGSIFERWDASPTNKYAWTDDDLKAEIYITPTIKGADGQTKSNAPTLCFPYPGR